MSSSLISSSSLSSTSSINPSSASVTTQSTTTTGGVPDCSTTYGAVPYPGDCTKYYWCSNGRYTLQFCPPKLLFDSTNGYCDLPENVSGC
ncbi:hypothetical protein SK128_024378 [Halocaridina rubra]|uniref:Chitin-binding type-2 domain-containing protein n=1 Tax=Halocaridina rubra TaxID=373956 RepID=A0AAN8W9C7_HALRR